MPNFEMPELKKIKVSPDRLILDPNNPRLTVDHDIYVSSDHITDPGVIEDTRDKIGSEKFQIEELKKSIVANGWQPIDSIFVRAHGNNYLVLEGNRRIAAIRGLLASTLDKTLRNTIEEIEVLEVIADDDENLQRKINYLLGVRHHGALKKWSPFAQAYNIYERYLEKTKQTNETFRWDQDVGMDIANALNINEEKVRERILVYRGMQQIGNTVVVKDSEPNGGGMRGNYYSVCAAVLASGSVKLSDYIWKDPSTFLLNDDSLDRMNELCHFSCKNRLGAPISKPQEWSPLINILKDDDEKKREDNLKSVIDEKQRPSDVWATRAEELRKLQWDKWLTNVDATLGMVSLGDDFGSDATEAITVLVAVLAELDKRDQEQE